MGKGHYHGGGTLIGFGTTSGSKGRRGGLNLTSPAEKQRARVAQTKRRKQVADRIKASEKVVKQLSDQWQAEKGRKHYDRLLTDARAKTSPLAAALLAAINVEDETNS